LLQNETKEGAASPVAGLAKEVGYENDDACQHCRLGAGKAAECSHSSALQQTCARI